MKARVDREVCTGTQNCVATAPEYFQVDNEGLSHVIKTPVEPQDEGLVREAGENCPVGAVILEDDSGEQIYP